jgi:RNA polymerase sigma-70 factor, ECF subfamily
MEVVERARNGSIGAFEELVKRYQTLAFRTAFLITGDATEAEDAAQSGFVKAYYALGRFREGSAFKPWVLTIVANEARTRNRSARRRAQLELRLIEDRPRDDAAPSPERAVLDREPLAAVATALDRLSEKDRLVILLRYLLDLSEKETAEVLRCPVGTVKSRLSRALPKLRAELGAGRTDLLHAEATDG